MQKLGLFEKLGEFYEFLGEDQNALNTYVNGGCYFKAVDLAKRVSPGLVVKL